MRCLAILAVVAIGGTAAADPAGPAAAADPAAGLADWLDRDAPIALRLEAGALERLAELARAMGGEPAAAAAVATLGGVRYLGFDPLSVRGWRSAGLDPDGPMLVQLGAIDAVATDRTYRELARSGGQWGTRRAAPPTLWRSRLVARAVDPARARVALASGALLERAVVVDPARAAELGALLGVAPARAPLRDLAELDVALIGVVPSLGALAFVRQRGDVVALDVLAPFAGDALDWRRDRAALRAALDRPARARGLPTRGAGALAQPGIALWAQPLGVYHLGQAWRATTLLRGRIGGAPLPDVARGCARLRGIERTALTDLALRLTPGERQLELHLRYGHRGDLAAALATVPESAAAPLAGVVGADLTARLPLARLAGVRGLPRPAFAALGWDDLWVRARWCAAGAVPALYAFAWPEIAALWLDELETALPDAGRLTAGLGGIAIAVERADADRREAIAAVELAIDEAALPLARRALDAVFGRPIALAQPRAHQRWGGGPLQPWLLPGPPARIGAGFGRSLAWRLAARPPLPGRLAAAPLLQARGRLERLLPALADGRRFQAAARAAASRLGRLVIDARVGADALELDATIELR